jgi:hypothetical protein
MKKCCISVEEWSEFLNIIQMIFGLEVYKTQHADELEIRYVLTGNQPPADGRLYFNMFNNLDK